MLKITLWGTLSGIVAALLIFIVLTSKGKRAERQNKFSSLFTFISIIVFSGGAAGAASYFLSLPYPSRSIPLFPSTGSEAMPQTFVSYARNLYGNPIDGIITLSLFIVVAFLVVVAFRAIALKEETEKSLTLQKTATKNALDNLQVEKGKLANQVEELESLNTSMVGRELKMVELKKEIATLHEQAKRDDVHNSGHSK